MFSFGSAQLVILAGVCLLLFGKRIPAAMRAIGSSFPAFQDGLQDDK